MGQARADADIVRLAIASLPAEPAYDVVALNDVLEHPLDPAGLLRESVRRLKENGLLSIWTPAGDACLNEKEPTTFRVDLEHMQYLTAAGMPCLSEALGREIVHFGEVGRHWLEGVSPARQRRDAGWKQRIKNVLKAVPGIVELKRFRTWLQASPDPQTGRSNLFCILRKKKGG